ncbi:MAG: hypothetical protein KF742_01740 [Cryobacterium sp.]|nr:hypothetical protein [Cryobacterium sp.]
MTALYFNQPTRTERFTMMRKSVLALWCIAVTLTIAPLSEAAPTECANKSFGSLVAIAPPSTTDEHTAFVRFGTPRNATFLRIGSPLNSASSFQFDFFTCDTPTCATFRRVPVLGRSAKFWTVERFDNSAESIIQPGSCATPSFDVFEERADDSDAAYYYDVPSNRAFYRHVPNANCRYGTTQFDDGNDGTEIEMQFNAQTTVYAMRVSNLVQARLPVPGGPGMPPEPDDSAIPEFLRVLYSSDGVVFKPFKSVGNCTGCADGLYGEACTLTSHECRQSRCGGHGWCTGRLDGCVCDAGYNSTANCTVVANSTLLQRCANGTLFGPNCAQDAAECAADRCAGQGDCLTTKYGCTCTHGVSKAYYDIPVLRGRSMKRQPLRSPRAAKYVRITFRHLAGQALSGAAPFYFELYANGSAWAPLGVQSGALSERAVSSSDWGAGHPSCWRIAGVENTILQAQPGCPLGVHPLATGVRWVMVALPGPNTTVVTGLGIYYPPLHPHQTVGVDSTFVDRALEPGFPESVYVDYSNDSVNWVSSSGFSWLTVEPDCDHECGPSFFRHESDTDYPCNVTAAACASTMCSGHGTCYSENGGITTSCVCDVGYSGSNCSTCEYQSGGGPHDLCIKCPPMTFGENCTQNATTCRAERCSDAGDCTGELIGCACDLGHAGADCSFMEVDEADTLCGPGHELTYGTSANPDGACRCLFIRMDDFEHDGYFLATAENEVVDTRHYLTNTDVDVWDPERRMYVRSREVEMTPVAKVSLSKPAINATAIRIVIHATMYNDGAIPEARFFGMRFELYGCGPQGGEQNCSANGFVPLGVQSGAIPDSHIWSSATPAEGIGSPLQCARLNQPLARDLNGQTGRRHPSGRECDAAGFFAVVSRQVGTSNREEQFVQVEFDEPTSVYAVGIQAGTHRYFFDPPTVVLVYPSVFSVWYRTAANGSTWLSTLADIPPETLHCEEDRASFYVEDVGWGHDAVYCSKARCHGHGWCIGHGPDGGCACEPGFDGANCQFCRVNDTFCGPCVEEGMFAPTCNETAEQCALSRCNGQGNCTTEAAGCTCEVNYFGHSCNISQEDCAAQFCGGEGTCYNSHAVPENFYCHCTESEGALKSHQIAGWDASTPAGAAAALVPSLHIFDQPFVARLVAVVQQTEFPMAGSGGMSLRMELYTLRSDGAYPDPMLVPIGLQSGAVPDSAFHVQADDPLGAKCARLHQPITNDCPDGGWAMQSDLYEDLFLVIDLGTPTLIAAIALQRAEVLYNQGGSNPYRSGPFVVYYSNTSNGVEYDRDNPPETRPVALGLMALHWNLANAHPDCESCPTGLYGEFCNVTALECSENRCFGNGMCLGDASCTCAEGFSQSTNCEVCVDDTGEDCGDGPVARKICSHTGHYALDASSAPECPLNASVCAEQRCLDRGHCTGVFSGCECVGGFGSGSYSTDGADGDQVVLRAFPARARHVTHLRFSSSDAPLALRVEAYSCNDSICSSPVALGLADPLVTPDTHFSTSTRYEPGFFPWCARLNRDFLLNPQTAAEASNPAQRCLHGAFRVSEPLPSGQGLVVRLPSRGASVDAVAVQGDPRYEADHFKSFRVEFSTDDGVTWHDTSPHDCSFCRPGLHGPHCDESFEHCSETRCTSLDHGHCTSRAHPELPVCQCKPGFFEADCAIDAEECAVERCFSAGTCTGQTAGCRCNGTFFGPTCLLTLEQCSLVHCGNGTHTFGACTAEHDVCECSSPAHDATLGCVQCLPNFNTTASPWPACAQCKRGRFGAACEQTAAECMVQRCANLSACTGRLAGCALGETGESGVDPCGPRGQLRESGEACDCAAGYYENRTDPAFSLARCVLPCQNGGRYSVQGDRCVCPGDFGGALCELFVPQVQASSTTETAVIAAVLSVAALAALVVGAKVTGVISSSAGSVSYERLRGSAADLAFEDT